MKKFIYTILLLLFAQAYAHADSCQTDTVTIFTIGDSTMANKSTDSDRQERGWGQMLSEYLVGPIKVENHAKDGRSTKSFLSEGRWDVVLSKLHEGDYVFIQFGHNDEKTDPELHTDPMVQFHDNLCRFVSDVRSKGAIPVLLNSIVRRNYPPKGMKEHKFVYETEGDSLVDTHGDYSCVPKIVAKEQGVPFVDMTAISKEIVSNLGPEKSKELYMWIPKGTYEFCPDGKIDNTHFTVLGARTMASAAIDAIIKVVPELAEYRRESVLTNGVPWFDTDGNVINAHGACIVEDGGKYWLFGEYKSDESNAFPGFGCYSSTDLVNWKFERVVLPVQKDGILGSGRVGERVKVMRCPATGEYVMLMHADNLKYTDPNIGIAVCDRINGDYKLLGTIEYDGNPIKQWDMGTFQDEDGTGYLLIHHGPIYKLSEDYRSVVGKAAHIEGMGESPAMFKKDGIYYLLTSNLTSWERNDNYYFTAPSVEGPWSNRGLFCPEGSLTHNSQCTFVLPLKHNGDIIPMYMGDRWSYPHQASAATYVWLPMTTDGVSLSIPKYWAKWDVEKVNEVISKDKYVIHDWSSNVTGDILAIPFHGRRISIIGESNNKSGYAWVSIKDKYGKILHRQYVDFYSKTKDYAPQYVSRLYPEDDYVLEVEVSGENSVWFDKKGNRFGGTDYFVNVSKTIVE